MNIKNADSSDLLDALAVHLKLANTRFGPLALFHKVYADRIHTQLHARLHNLELALNASNTELITAQDELASLQNQFDDYFDASAAARDPVEMPRPEGLWEEFDSSVWAKQFMAYTQKPLFVLDEKTMDSWFAQALMTGYSRGKAEAYHIPADPNPTVWKDPADPKWDTLKCWQADLKGDIPSNCNGANLKNS